MTLLETTRSRSFFATALVVTAVSFCAMFAYQSIRAQAAKQSVIAEDARVMQRPAAGPVAGANPAPVLVELFTSEGCSSCPPADALLAHLQRDQPVPGADVIALEEHVDYWESLGWHDRFSSHEFTDRQSRYTQRLRLDDNYTPQMIVDGTDQFVGNDTGRALRSIAEAAHTAKVALTLTPLDFDGAHLSGAVSVTPTSGALLRAGLYAAVIQTMASTQVQRGENGGRTLNHVSVLRSLQPIGGSAGASSAPLKFSLAVPKDAPPQDLRVVVFLQLPDQGQILGAVSSGGAHRATPATSLAPHSSPASNSTNSTESIALHGHLK
jgi:hypothetical protein